MVPPARRWVLGEYVLDKALFELRCGNARRTVQPKVLSLMFYLVERSERVVTKDELLSALWPDATVSAASITRAIRGARVALGDTGESQASIRTVVGRGYQWVRPHSVVQDSLEQVTNDDSANALDTTSRSSDDELFVGRESVMQVLDTHLGRARSGAGQCVLIAGEPGIGKTRLMQELAKRSRNAGALVLVGRCMEVEGAPAYWPVLQMLRQCIEQRGARAVLDHMGPGAAEIVEALPQLRALLPEVALPPQIDGAHARFRLFDSVTRLLLRLAAEQPLVLVLEDLQRADQPTLRLLLFIAREIGSARIMLAATHRHATLRDAQVPLLLAELAHCEPSHSLTLTGMQPADVACYLELALGEAAPTAAVEAVVEQTGGNALFVRQLVLAFRAARPRPSFSWFEHVPADPSLSAAISRWLEVLSPRCRALLSMAAVIGRDFSAAGLARAQDLTIDAVFEQLAEALEAGMVRSTQQGALSRHRFVHALVRDVLYDSLTEPERARKHARVALALEAQHPEPDSSQLSELAHHFAQAMPLHPERAHAYGVRAARDAAHRLAYEEAALHFERTLQLLTLQAPDSATSCQLLLEQGEALLNTEQHEAARAALGRALALARKLRSTEVIVRVAIARSMPPEEGSVDRERVLLLEEALECLPAEDARHPLLLALLAKALLFSGDPERRFMLAHSALDAARRQDAPHVLGDVLRLSHLALSEPHQHAQRRALSDELIALARARQDAQLLLHGCMTQVHDCLERGELSGADASIATMEALASHVRQPYFLHQVALLRSTRAALSGRLAEAERLAAQALQLGRRVNGAMAWHCYCVQQHVLLRLNGKLEEAEAMVRAISAQHPALTGWRAVLACLEAQLGRPQHARDELQRLLDAGLTQAHRDPYVLTALAPLADLCAMVGDSASAHTLYAAMAPHAEIHGMVAFDTYSHGPTTRYLASLAARMKRFDLAQTHFEEALASTAHLPVFQCLASCDYADMLARRANEGDKQRAAELLGRALELCAAHRLSGLAVYCDFIAQRCSITPLGSSARHAASPATADADATRPVSRA